MPSMLGGGEVMADALVSGTPVDGGVDLPEHALNRITHKARVNNVIPNLFILYRNDYNIEAITNIKRGGYCQARRLESETI